MWRVTQGKMLLIFFLSVAARLNPLSGHYLQFLCRSELVHLLLSRPLPTLHIGLFMTATQIIVQTGFATRHRSKIKFWFWRSDRHSFDLTKEGSHWMAGVWLLCTLCTACCNKASMNGSAFAYNKTWDTLVRLKSLWKSFSLLGLH